LLARLPHHTVLLPATLPPPPRLTSSSSSAASASPPPPATLPPHRLGPARQAYRCPLPRPPRRRLLPHLPVAVRYLTFSSSMTAKGEVVVFCLNDPARSSTFPRPCAPPRSGRGGVHHRSSTCSVGEACTRELCGLCGCVDHKHEHGQAWPARDIRATARTRRWSACGRARWGACRARGGVGTGWPDVAASVSVGRRRSRRRAEGE
jgi:hypothetical protein